MTRNVQSRARNIGLARSLSGCRIIVDRSAIQRFLFPARLRCCTNRDVGSRSDPRRSRQASRDHHRHRAGVSLVELLVVMSMLTAIMGLVGTIFHRLFASDQLVMRRALLERSTSRLSDRFRQDVHTATTHRLIVAGDKQPAVLELLASPDGITVKYSVTEGLVQREVFEKEKRISFDRFLLPESTASLATAADSAWIVLAIERPLGTATSEPTATPSHRTLTIEAELGREARLSRRSAKTAPPQEKPTTNESAPSKQESPRQESSEKESSQ